MKSESSSSEYVNIKEEEKEKSDEKREEKERGESCV